MSADPRSARAWRVGGAAALACALLFAAALATDPAAPGLDLDRTVGALADADPRALRALLHMRLPRALLAVLSGAALAVAGALLQALYRNPLADPTVTGISQGAVASVVAMLELGPAASIWMDVAPSDAPRVAPWTLPAAALVGGLATAALAWAFARRARPTRLLLNGVLLGGILASLTSLMLLRGSEHAGDLIHWLAGSLHTATWPRLGVTGAALACALPLLIAALPRANLLRLGDELTSTLGQRPAAARALTLAASCALTAGAVCTVGGLSFVSLVAPHLCRLVLGADLRRTLPSTALTGAALVLAADWIARVVPLAAFGEALGVPMRATSLPVGVYLALLTAPLLVAMLAARARSLSPTR